MQQNVQSEYKNINNNYSQERNSLPSKGQESEIVNHRNDHQIPQHEMDSIEIDGKHYKASPQAIERLKLIEEEIRKQKEMISLLKKQNQQEIENILEKSYFSLNKHEFINDSQDNQLNPTAQQHLETKTQANYEVLQTRKTNATRQLENEEDKYRENIRKIQLRRSEIKKKLTEDKEIPIKIMDLKQFQLRKNKKDGPPEHPQQQQNQAKSHNIEQGSLKKIPNNQIPQIHTNILGQDNLEKQKSNKLQSQKSKQIGLNQQKSIRNSSKGPISANAKQHKQESPVVQPHISIAESQSKCQLQNNSKLAQNSPSKQIHPQNQSFKSHYNSNHDDQQDLAENHHNTIESKASSRSQNNVAENEHSKISDNRHSRVSQNNSKVMQNNKSRISSKTNQKNYSVKKSSVVIPESNDSIKQIQQRKSKKSQSCKKSSLNQALSEKEKHESSFTQKEQHQSQTNQKEKSLKQPSSKLSQVASHKSNEILENTSEKKQELKSLHHSNKEGQQKSFEQSQKSSKSKNSGKKPQKVQLMYVPHAPKSPSQKSFKKTDKSIQWSQVDLSMYGKSNETNNINQSSSNLLHEINQKDVNERQSNVESQSNTSANKINMKKVKNSQNVFFEEGKKQRIQQNLRNLAPVQASNKQKSQKSNVYSKSSQNRGSIIASRQGSVKQKVEKYDKFHRQHSLNNKKLENKKQEIVQELKNKSVQNKAPSYRSRKSNPISSSSKAKPKTVNGQHQGSSKKTQINQAQKSDMQTSRILISKEQIQFLHRQIKELEQKLEGISKKQEVLIAQKTSQQRMLKEEKQSNNQQQTYTEQNKPEEEQPESQQNLEQKKIMQNNKQKLETSEIHNVDALSGQNGMNPNQSQEQSKEPQNKAKQQNLIQSNINGLQEIETQFTKQKEGLLEQVSRLKKIIRDLQIQKIKSIENDQTIFSTKNQHEQKKMQTENNEVGVIVRQNMKQTIDLNNSRNETNSISQDHRDKSKSPFGKIIKNITPQNNSRISQNVQAKNKSHEKHFRISASKKASIHSDMVVNKNQFGKTFDSIQLSSIKKRNQNPDDEEKNELLGKRKNGFYPINQKEGYVVANAEFGSPKNSKMNEESAKQQVNDSNKVNKSEVTKEQVLQKFHRTNREFHNFIESSRIINETNSSMSSQNNFFFNALNQTHQSNDFLLKRNSDRNDDYNPQNANILAKMSSSNLQINQETTPKKNFQQSFTRIIEQIKNDNEDEENSDVPQIQIRDIEMPNLPKTPDITLDQDQLMELAKSTFKIFDIQVKNEDQDFNMKKYKNCVIFTKGADTVLWHYNGKFYLGGWKNKQNGEGQKTGYGIEIVPDKHIYKGQFMNGKKHGTGILKMINGNIYDGQWIQGIKNGQGIYYELTTKVAYQGEWKDGKKNGFGLLKFSQTEYYQGTFLKSVKEGYGTQVFVNGDRYKGQYRKGKFHGKGKYCWANGSVYEGDFFQGMRNGNGTWKSAKTNFDIYVGCYKDDKKCGYGRYVWSNGCIYQGSFAQDVKHGKGKLIYTDGKQIKGVWEEGSLLEAVTQNTKQKHQEQRLRKGPKLSGIGSKVK